MTVRRTRLLLTALTAGLVLLTGASLAQLVDLHVAPNTAGSGISKTLVQQIGAGRGDVVTPNSSIVLLRRDPCRSIRRGRQLFQRKFALLQGLGPRTGKAVSLTSSGISQIDDTQPLVGTFIDEDFSLAFGFHSTLREVVNTFRSKRSDG